MNPVSPWLTADGGVNLDALDQLAANLKAVTDSNAAIDKVIKGAKLGAPVVACFKCNHSGLYYPSDYGKQWGKLYGIGQGPDILSEILDSDYDTDPPALTNHIEDITQIMHPLSHVRMQVDLVTVPQDEFNAGQAIPAHQDKNMRKRVAIIRKKQLANPRGKLRLLQAAWERTAQ